MAQGTVVTYAAGREGYLRTHEGITHTALARELAGLKGYAFGGEYVRGRHAPAHCYFVPRDTLCAEDAAELGIREPEDLFGGVVPLGFARTKVITHGLLGEESDRPPGWSRAFSRAVADEVLPGFTVFNRREAELAGLRLLEGGPVRVKNPLAAGGRDQWVVTRREELTAVLAPLADGDIARHGLVLERNLSQVSTLSVGLVVLEGLTLAYHGTQWNTRDNLGRSVYGGSRLFVVRGGGEALLGLELPPRVRRAIAQALVYDRAATEHYGVIASRRNYDVAVGVDDQGRELSGVLEQSWRVGGASGAELAAFQELQRLQERPAVSASCTEVYGEEAQPPPGARVVFQGLDPEVGPLLKYTVIHEDA
ncbi:uncharacterized protein DUF3182 [Archangium gephyra]|uniref:Biotin carboxylase n=1 Tax=Archangium gephyra TaxID=48 RepID=A0AAC8QGT8_9BACT|nr:DUF3182 family protein [Archangium gephyra]AKJ07204.1 Biotin carboxylase [Archangium gephyra]REG26614.1 uncharacterized protein DUF3182 [Archangium gephyra]